MTGSVGATVLVLVIYVLAVARIVRFINYDTLLDPLRITAARIFGPDSKVEYFIGCPWCVSIWVAAPTAWLPLFFADNRAVQYVAIVLAASHLVGLFAPLSSDEDLHIESVDADDHP